MAGQVFPYPATTESPWVVLVVGNLVGWQLAGRALPHLSGFHFAAFSDVTETLLQKISPRLVLSALMGEDYDVIELGRRLESMGFSGQYRALTSGLPNPRLVLNEVRAVAPAIDFDLLDVQHGIFSGRD